MRRFIIFLVIVTMILGIFIPAGAAPGKTNGYKEAEETFGAVATAHVTKLKGNQNGLTITVTVNDNVVAETYELIKNNAAGEFRVGDYKVYVSTYGNDKIDCCFITYAPSPVVELNEINGISLENATVSFYSGDVEIDMSDLVIGSTYTVMITLDGFKTFSYEFVYTTPGMVIDVALEPEQKLEPGVYTFNDGKYWNQWTTVTDADDVGIFGDHENEIQIATNQDGIQMTRIWVGDHNYNFTNVHPYHPYGPVRLYIGIENLGDQDYDKTVFGDRIGALTYKSEYPIIEWIVGGNNPLVEGEVPEGDQSYLATIGKSHIVLSKGPLDYTRPVDEQLADGYGVKVPMNNNTVIGSCNSENEYRYLTIMGIPPGSAWGGDDWVQPAFISISVEVPYDGIAPGEYIFEDGRYWNEWESINPDGLGEFGEFEVEAQIAENEDGIVVKKVFVGPHISEYGYQDPNYPHRAQCQMIGTNEDTWGTSPEVVFGSRSGALTFKTEYPIVSWQFGNQNPLVEETHNSFFPNSTTVLLHKEPLDYTQPFDTQGVIAKEVSSVADWNMIFGDCNAEDGYTYITIISPQYSRVGWGPDYVQLAYSRLIVQVGSGSGGPGAIGTTENIPNHVPEDSEFEGLQLDENGRLVPSAYHQIETFETGKEPSLAIYVGLDGSDSNPGTYDKPLRSIARALAYAKPGTSILIKPGVYNSMRINCANLHGTEDEPIWIGGIPGMERPVFDGHNAGATFIDCSYIVLHDLEVRNSMTDPQATGIHVYASNQAEWPNLTHHFVFRGLYVHHINYQQFKLSDVVDYWLFDCEISHDGNGQSAPIDVVGGVGRGVIAYNYLHDTKAVAIQLKGNAFDTDVYGNMFRNIGAQTINVGQVTGLQYFRPDIYSVPPNTMYEARDIKVYSNIFIDVGSSVAFWSSTDSYFVNNTVINTKNQTFRLLPSGNEDILAYYGQSHNNTIANNIFYSSGFYFNVDSSPYGMQTLVVDNNFFHNTSNPGSVPGSGGIVNYRNNKGGNVQFINLSNLMLKEESPAATGGYNFDFAKTDFYGRPFAEDRSYGAVQYVEFEGDEPLPPHPGDGWTGERRAYPFSDIRYPAENGLVWSTCTSDDTLGRFGSLAHESAVYTDENDIEVYRTIVGNWDWQWDYSRLFFDQGLPTTKPIGGGQFSGAITYKFPHPVTGWSFEQWPNAINHQYRDGSDLLYVIPSTAPLDFTNYIDLSEATLTKPWGAADSRTYSAADGYYYITVVGASGKDRTWIRNMNFTLAIPSDGGSSKLPDDDEWTGGRKVMAFVDRLQQPNQSTPEAPLPVWDSAGVDMNAIAITDESSNVISYGTFENDEGIKVYRLTAGDFLHWPYIFYYNHTSDAHDPDVWTIGGAYDSAIVYKMPYPITGYDVNMHLGSAMLVGLSKEAPDLTSKEAFEAGMGRTDRIWTDYINKTVSNEVDPEDGYYYLTIFGPQNKDMSAYGYWHRIYVNAPDLDNP